MEIREVPTRKFLPMFEKRYEPAILDSTAIKEFKQCPRKYFYRMVLGRKPAVEKNELIFAWGSAIHKFAELRAGGMGAAEAAFEAVKLYRPFPPENKYSYLSYQRFLDTCKLLNDKLTEEMQSHNVQYISPEQAFSVEMPDGEFIGGRWDLIYTHNGRLCIRDYKTTTKERAFFVASTDPSDQATRYLYAASKVHGKDTAIVFMAIYNKKSGSPEIYQVPFTKDEEYLESWETEQLWWHARLRECREKDLWPMAETSQCTWCDYRKVCAQNNNSQRAWTLKNEFALSPWNHQNVEQHGVSDV